MCWVPVYGSFHWFIFVTLMPKTFLGGGLDGQWKQIWKDSFKSRGKDSSGDSERDLNSIVLRLRSETGVMQLLFWASLVLSHFFAAIQAQVRYEEYVAVASSLVSSPYPILYLAGLD